MFINRQPLKVMVGWIHWDILPANTFQCSLQFTLSKKYSDTRWSFRIYSPSKFRCKHNQLLQEWTLQPITRPYPSCHILLHLPLIYSATSIAMLFKRMQTQYQNTLTDLSAELTNFSCNVASLNLLLSSQRWQVWDLAQPSSCFAVHVIPNGIQVDCTLANWFY